MATKTLPLVTFGRMERGPTAGDTSTMTIYRDGVEVGVIEGEYQDVGATSYVWRVCAYTVIFWHAAGLPPTAERAWGVDVRANEARSVLARAKRYARTALTNTSKEG